MNVRCPSCGADVEFRYDDSFVRVCSHCNSAVVRGDRGPETLGRFADVMPIESPLRLFAEGRYGSAGFLLIGMAQLRHAAGGVWQEWYAKLDGGQWAWIAEAQGRLYVTFERPDVAAPAYDQLAPGAQVALAGGAFTVAERGNATYRAAIGEIPYRLVPGSTFHFVDLSDSRGGFATIDYGDGSEPPAVYIGYQVTPQGLGISGGETAPQLATPAATGARLACPNCNGSLELRAPDQTLRVACPYCATLVSVEAGTLSIIAKQVAKPALDIPLGATATFRDKPDGPDVVFTVIGYLARGAYIDAEWWPFEEYLLHAPSVGFRWLVCSDGHWSYVQPVTAGAVAASYDAIYRGVRFRRYADSALRVDRVLGEFYWRVEIGERVEAQDYVAPPAMLSSERSPTELNWSLGTYLTQRQVTQAFRRKLALPVPVGVAPNQPYGRGVARVSALLITAFLAVAIGKCTSAPRAERAHEQFSVPMGNPPRPPADPGDPSSASAEASDPPGNVMFSQKFHLNGGRNVAFELAANVSNNWLYAAIDLVNDDTGSVVGIDRSIEYYSGVDGGESWSEGSTEETAVIGPVQAGDYVLRIEAQHGGVGSVLLDIVVREGVFRASWFGIFGGALLVVCIFAWWRAGVFRRRQWENSNASRRAKPAPSSDDDDDGGSDDD